MTINYYAVLAVSPTATEEQIRKRFHALARQHHPDRFQGEEKLAAEAEFQSITQAFNVLRDPARRREYDVELRQAPGQSRAQDPERLVQVYLQRGIQAYHEGRFTEATDAFNRATDVIPGDARSWHHLALACSKEPRRSSMAMSAIRKACDLDSTNITYLKLAGELFAVGGLPLRAEKFYNQALKWGGSDPEIERALVALKI